MIISMHANVEYKIIQGTYMYVLQVQVLLLIKVYIHTGMRVREDIRKMEV